MQAFPALFKMHKTRSDRGSQTREFMVFLDRSVESSVKLIAAFCCIVCCIFFISVAVFFQYFPVEVSTECLEKDNHGRTLFCYSDSSLNNSSLPVDCANFSLTEVRELQFECYTIAVPAGLGIAIAVALALAKVAIMGVRVKRGKTERGVKRNTCIQRTIMKEGINRTTLYRRTLRYNHQRIHACKTFGLTAHHHRNTAH